jgi:transposase
LGRKSWLFCGSDRGGERAAVMYSLIVTAKMNDVEICRECTKCCN